MALTLTLRQWSASTLSQTTNVLLWGWLSCWTNVISVLCVFYRASRRSICLWRAMASPPMGHCGTCPSTSNNFSNLFLEIFPVNFRAAQSLTATLCGYLSKPNFVFCDSSCGSSVAAIWTLFSVLFPVIFCATKECHVVFRPSQHHADPGNATRYVSRHYQNWIV